MKWVVTGASGMLGSDLTRILSAAGEECIGLGRSALDIGDREGSRSRIIDFGPDVIVNCAAYTKVDDAEENEELALNINGTAVRGLAEAADACDALLVQLSTDFVFDGRQVTPYGVDAPVAPLSAYGRTKLAGEEAARDARKHIIIRTSWLFGARGWNFVEAMRKQIAGGRHELRVVNDQRGRPTYTPHLARAVADLAGVASGDEASRGVFHYADSPECTWFDFATEIVAQLRERGEAPADARVLPVASSEFPRPAVRPSYSVLSTARYEEMTGQAPASWKDGLREYLEKKN